MFVGKTRKTSVQHQPTNLDDKVIYKQRDEWSSRLMNPKRHEWRNELRALLRAWAAWLPPRRRRPPSCFIAKQIAANKKIRKGNLCVVQFTRASFMCVCANIYLFIYTHELFTMCVYVAFAHCFNTFTNDIYVGEYSRII